MNIAFWSMTSGRSATSSNMLDVGAMSALAYSVEGTLLQLDQFSMSLDEAFGERRQTNLLMEEYSYYSKKGIDRLVDKAQLEDINIDNYTEYEEKSLEEFLNIYRQQGGKGHYTKGMKMLCYYDSDGNAKIPFFIQFFPAMG